MEKLVWRFLFLYIGGFCGWAAVTCILQMTAYGVTLAAVLAAVMFVVTPLVLECLRPETESPTAKKGLVFFWGWSALLAVFVESTILLLHGVKGAGWPVGGAWLATLIPGVLIPFLWGRRLDRRAHAA